MTDSSGTSSSAPLPGLGDLFMLLGTSNPLAGVSKAFGQFQRGVGDFLQVVENFNDTMEQMNQIAGRVNRLLDDVEPPIRALMPQVTRTLQNADAMVTQLNSLPRDVEPLRVLHAVQVADVEVGRERDADDDVGPGFDGHLRPPFSLMPYFASIWSIRHA